MEIIEKEIPKEEKEEEEKWKRLKEILQRRAEEAIEKEAKRYNPRRLKIWNHELAMEIKEKQRLFRKWISTKNDQDREKRTVAENKKASR